MTSSSYLYNNEEQGVMIIFNIQIQINTYSKQEKKVKDNKHTTLLLSMCLLLLLLLLILTQWLSLGPLFLKHCGIGHLKKLDCSLI